MTCNEQKKLHAELIYNLICFLLIMVDEDVAARGVATGIQERLAKKLLQAVFLFVAFEPQQNIFEILDWRMQCWK